MTALGVVLVTFAAVYVIALLWALRDAPEVRAEIPGGPGPQEPVASQLATGPVVESQLSTASQVQHAIPGPEFLDVGDGNDWRRLPYEITKAVEDPAGPGVLVEQLNVGLGLAIDQDTDEAVIIERGTGELTRIPMYRLRDVDPVLLVQALEDTRVSEAADRGDLMVDAPPNDEFVRVWIRGDEGRHFGVHRCCCVPGWPYEEQ